MIIYEFGAWLIIIFFLAHAILIADAASQGKSPLHFSELEGRHVLTDIRDCPTYAAGIVYDPLECGHTELFDIDNDLKLISEAHFNLVRLKTGNNLAVTEKVLATAAKYYPELIFIVSFKPYQYSTDVQSGKDFQGKNVSYDWSNPALIFNSTIFATDFVSKLKHHSNVWAWEIFEDISLGEYIKGGNYYNGYWNTASGREAFRQWMYKKYHGNLSRMNSELQLWFQNWNEVENEAIYPSGGIISCGDPWRRDFIEFSAVNFGLWVSPISSAIREIDPEHMITGSVGDNLYISGVPIDKICEWGLDFPSLKGYNADANTLFLSTAAADLNNRPVLISEWGIQTAFREQIQYAEDEQKKADLISAQALWFASNARVMGYCYFSLYDSKNLNAPDFGIVDVYGNPKGSYYAIKEKNALILQIGKQLAERSWENKTAIILTSDAIYPPRPWDQEFVNLYDELYRMGVRPCIIGEHELAKSPEYLSFKYDHIFAISRIYSFGGFKEEHLLQLKGFVERAGGNTLIVLPITGMYGRNAQLQPSCELTSKKLSGYSTGSSGPTNIWNVWGNDGNTYVFSILWQDHALDGEKFPGVSKWHWNDYSVDDESVTTLIKNNKGYVSLTVHELDTGSQVITLFPDIYVNEMPPSIIDPEGNRSAHLFTHLILEYLEIPHSPYLESVSFISGEYRISSFYPHSIGYDTTIWGAKEPVPVFSDVIGSFKHNSSFVARIYVAEDTGTIKTEATSPSTFMIDIPSGWQRDRTWLHVLDDKDNQIGYRIIGDKIEYKIEKPGTYRIMYYQFIPWSIWVTRGVIAFVTAVIIVLGVIKFCGRRKRNIATVFEEICEKYPLKAYAIVSDAGVISKSDNWLPDPAELMKLFERKSVIIQGFRYDVVFKDEERGIAVAKKEDIGTLVGIELESQILVTWSPPGTEVNEAVKASVSFANKILS